MAYRMMGLGGLVVPEQVQQLSIGGFPLSWWASDGHGGRISRDGCGPVFESLDECRAHCRSANVNNPMRQYSGAE